MLARVLVFMVCANTALVGCSRAADSNLVGSWRGHSEGMAGEIHFASDHTFTSREWDATNSVPDAGDWHVSGNKLVMIFHGNAHPKKHVEFSLAMSDEDHFTLLGENGAESTFERLK